MARRLPEYDLKVAKNAMNIIRRWPKNDHKTAKDVREVAISRIARLGNGHRITRKLPKNGQNWQKTTGRR